MFPPKPLPPSHIAIEYSPPGMEATTRQRQLGSENLEATTWKRQLGSDNSEATTCDPYRLPYKTVHHPLLGKNIEVVVRKVADGYHQQWITRSSSASSTYPIPEAQEHQNQLGDMTTTCNEPLWKVGMTEAAEEEFKNWLGKRVDNTENRQIALSLYNCYTQ